ncbi:hypothetical protein RB595_006877 [Gaeumannomyces hyphopodioides]
MGSSFPMLRTSRSEASLRRKPAAAAPAQEPAVPNIPKFFSSKPPTTPSQHHPAYASAGIGLGIRTDLRPVRGPEDLFQDDSASSVYADNDTDADGWNDEYANRMVPKAVPPLPLRIPGQHAALGASGPDAPSPPLPPQGTVQRHVEVHTQEHTRHLQMRARTFTPVEVPDLTRPATASGTPVSLSPATPTSAHDGSAFPPAPAGDAAAAAAAAAADAAGPAKKNFFKKAAGDAALFAGGLLPHPVESARHHSIMRHSPAIVMYQGPETSVSISVFSDTPLPADRTLWLQQRGFTGDKGMRLKSLVGATGSWINVTPAQRAGPEAVPEGDERAFQRDVAKWLKKAAKAGGKVAKHAWRETHVVRIPAAADDGYFRIILCSNANSENGGGGGGGHYNNNHEYEDDAAGAQGYYYKKKVLCSSPVFRVASASTDVSILRGASVSTMPLEVGIKVASTVGVVYVSKYTKPVTMAAGAAQGTVMKKAATVVESKVKHSAAIARAGKMAYHHSGVQGELEGANARYRAEGHAAGRYDALGASPGAQVFGENTVGADDGPEAPFPLKFAGKVVRGSAASLTSGAGAPTANLDDVPEEVRQRLRGVYFGWACVAASGGSRKKPLDERVDFDWHPAVITAGPAAAGRNGQAAVAARSSVAVHLLQEGLAGVEFFDVRLKVVLMGYLRPRLARDTPPAKQQQHLAVDSALARASLARECWQPDVVRDFIREQQNARTFSDRLLGARDKAQMQMDRVPLHLLGVRTEASGLMDRAHGNGGYWIPRG